MRFLESLGNGTMNDFAGDMTQVLACLVQVGETGCPFSHALQAGRVALYESITPGNRGFLRDDALLVVVLVADGDDCSAATDTKLFIDDQAHPGQQPTLRCALEGHVCGGQPPPAVDGFQAPLTSCQAAETGALIPVNQIVDSLRQLKKRPDQRCRRALSLRQGRGRRPRRVARLRGTAG
jgi:hypothetical protein